MTRFLIEVPHDAKKDACERAVKVFMETGSHFMTNADWGCVDGEHKAWIIVDLDSKELARSILPPIFRQDAKITTLQRFSLEEIDEIRGLHNEE